MLLASLVVQQRLLLQSIANQLAIQLRFVLICGQPCGCFERVIGAANIPVGVAGKHAQHIVIGGDAEAAHATLVVGQRVLQKLKYPIVGQRLQHVDAAAG